MSKIMIYVYVQWEAKANANLSRMDMRQHNGLIAPLEFHNFKKERKLIFDDIFCTDCKVLRPNRRPVGGLSPLTVVPGHLDILAIIFATAESHNLCWAQSKLKRE
jgi:hypothetical protein